ncbi:unnamed protein product [Phaedon cochleariae]|uniref:PBZ-type domain-containing protein n=1 Tax=Phaedon cochleariae TaxID=80249 RepID=A0A9N9SFZ5_PHACE|nr:unnamed protein product [Phaedon cochleariae]
MTIVKIFKQGHSNQINEKDVISTLSDGEHIVGREKPLNCGDKRISRRHAIIIVKQDGVTLKSVHVNPCFFRSSQESNVGKLSKDNSIALNDGDQFSMLANSEWFRVKVTLGNSSENKPQPFCVYPNDRKRTHDGENFKENHKLLKTSEGNAASLLVSDNVNNHPPCSSFQNQGIIDAGEVVINDLDVICDDESEGDHSLDKNLNVNIASENEQYNHLVEEPGDVDSNENEQAGNKILNNGHGTEEENTSIPIVENQREYSYENYTTVQVESTTESSISPVVEKCQPQNSNGSNVPRQESHSNEHTIEQSGSTEGQNVPYQDNDRATGITAPITAEGIKTESSFTSEENILPSTSIKQESVSDENIEQKPVSMDNIKQEPVPDENIKQEPESNNARTNANPNDPSSSNDQNNLRRDRCWYGQNCYRKNPAHRLNISHPGDQDYDSDPNDVRAICPYGRACYRVNPQHRKEFKHYGKPAPKPSNVRVVVNVNNHCPCPQCRHDKPGYESDYDSDPENEL